MKRIPSRRRRKSPSRRRRKSPSRRRRKSPSRRRKKSKSRRRSFRTDSPRSDVNFESRRRSFRTDSPGSDVNFVIDYLDYELVKQIILSFGINAAIEYMRLRRTRNHTPDEAVESIRNQHNGKIWPDSEQQVAYMHSIRDNPHLDPIEKNEFRKTIVRLINYLKKYLLDPSSDLDIIILPSFEDIFRQITLHNPHNHRRENDEYGYQDMILRLVMPNYSIITGDTRN